MFLNNFKKPMQATADVRARTRPYSRSAAPFSISSRSPDIALLLFVATTVLIAALLQLHSARFPDPDGFYHFRHAALYRLRSPWLAEFPWVSASVIAKYKGDLWYGFHLLLIPFTAASDPVTGLKRAAIFLLAATVLLYLYGVLCFSPRSALNWQQARLRAQTISGLPFL